MKKLCTTCRRKLDLSEFYKNRSRPDGLYGACKSCHRKRVDKWQAANGESLTEYHRRWRAKDPASERIRQKAVSLKHRYGLTLKQYAEMIKSGRCELCGNKSPKLHIDHCHKTGRVRGAICGKCNRGLGHFNDDPELLIAATQYLRRRAPKVA